MPMFLLMPFIIWTMQRAPFGAVVTAEVYTTWTRETWTRHEVVGDKITVTLEVEAVLQAVLVDA